MAGRSVTRHHDTGQPDAADAAAEAFALRLRRLELDVEDLRFENARLKASIGEKQDEIMALSDRLGQLQRLLDTPRWVTVWTRLRRLNPLRAILRRLG